MELENLFGLFGLVCLVSFGGGDGRVGSWDVTWVFLGCGLWDGCGCAYWYGGTGMNK